MYCSNVEINDFNFGVGQILYGSDIVINLNDEKIIKALLNLDIKFLEALREGLLISEEIDAINTFKDNFEYYFTQENGWRKALEYHSFNEIEKYKRKALIVLGSTRSNDSCKFEAQRFLNILDGDIPEFIPSEWQILARKEEKFRSSRSKWLKLLIERDGYKCNKCLIDKDLCVKHIVSLRNGGETELQNLKLVCRKCMNKK